MCRVRSLKNASDVCLPDRWSSTKTTYWEYSAQGLSCHAFRILFTSCVCCSPDSFAALGQPTKGMELHSYTLWVKLSRNHPFHGTLRLAQWAVTVGLSQRARGSPVTVTVIVRKHSALGLAGS